MITPRTSHTCSECNDIATLIDTIDCRLAHLAETLYNDVVFMLDIPVPLCVISSLLHYRRILTYKAVNTDYASDYTVEMISNRIHLLKFK